MRLLAAFGTGLLLVLAMPLAAAQAPICVEGLDAKLEQQGTYVNVTWERVPGATDYHVYMSTDGGAFVLMGTVDPSHPNTAMGFEGYHGDLTFGIAVDGPLSPSCPTVSVTVEREDVEVPFFTNPMALAAGIGLSGVIVALVLARRRG